MNGKVAKHIRQAVKLKGLSAEKPQGSFLHQIVKHPVLAHFISLSSGSAKTSPAKQMITRLKRGYKARTLV